MLIEEITKPQIDEGIKDWITQAVLAAGLMFSPQDSEARPKPAVPAQTKSTVAQLAKVRAETPAQREQLLKRMAQAAGIRGTELAALMAQAAHETGGFKFMREIGGPKRFGRYEQGRKAKILGNTEPGDGAKYRGGGFLQITGKYNYDQISKQLGVDLVRNPQLIEKPGIAAAASLIYWKNRVKPNVKDFKDVKKVTKQINPGQKHAARRSAEFKKYVQKSKVK
jgi:putative chitinase